MKFLVGRRLWGFQEEKREWVHECVVGRHRVDVVNGVSFTTKSKRQKGGLWYWSVSLFFVYQTSGPRTKTLNGRCIVGTMECHEDVLHILCYVRSTNRVTKCTVFVTYYFKKRKIIGKNTMTSVLFLRPIRCTVSIVRFSYLSWSKRGW